MSKMKIVLFAIFLLLAIAVFLPSCFNFANINWRYEMENTHWSGLNTSDPYGSKITKVKMSGRDYVLVDGKVAPFTILDKEGLALMNTYGCFGCHKDGGEPASRVKVTKH